MFEKYLRQGNSSWLSELMFVQQQFQQWRHFIEALARIQLHGVFTLNSFGEHFQSNGYSPLQHSILTPCPSIFSS